FAEDEFIDVIFSSGNGIARVDDGWFEHAIEAEVLGLPVRLCPVEEMIWSKGFVMERERYDGADIAHLIRACGHTLDWPRLLNHRVLFGYVYPGERWRVPEAVMQELVQRLQREMKAPPPAEQVCQGTLLSREQYLTDIGHWGYRDARLSPRGTLSPEEIADW